MQRFAEAKHHWFKLAHVLFLLVANVLVVAFSVAALVHSRAQYEARAITATSNVASALGQTLTTSIAKVDLVLSASVEEIEKQLASGGIREKALDAYLVKRAASLKPMVPIINMVDESGAGIAGDERSKSSGFDYSGRDYFAAARLDPEPVLQYSRPVMALDLGKPVIVLARRVNAPGGRFAGVVTAAIDIDYFTNLLAQFDLGAKGTIALRDATRGLVTRFPKVGDKEAGRMGSRFISPEFKALLDSGAETGSFYTPLGNEGIARTFAVRKYQDIPFIIAVGVGNEEFLKDWYREIKVAVAMVVAFALLSVTVGIYLQRSVRQTLDESTRNRVYLQSAGDGVQILDSRGGLVEVNERFCGMLGCTKEDLFRMRAIDWAALWDSTSLKLDSFASVLGQSESITIETRMRKRDGSWLEAEITVREFQLQTERFFYLAVRDLSERKVAETRIQQLVYFDPLTQLPNRRMMVDRLQKAVAISQRTQQFGAILILDIDRFKLVNDVRGFEAGDELLRWIAERLATTFRVDDTLARLGGDEFAVLLEGLDLNEWTAASQAELAAEKVRAALYHRYESPNAGHAFQCSCSVGVTTFRGTAFGVDELLKQADIALSQAKAFGRNTVRFFSPAMEANLNERLALDCRMRQDFERGAFQLYFQSKHGALGETLGAEALLRWLPEGEAPISPVQFIPLAEETGFIVPLGSWVIQQACKKLKEWSADPDFAHLQLAINVSAKQFHQENFVEQLVACIDASGANPRRLKIELTEGVVLQDVDQVIARMQTIKALGVKFSLDDFGTGFSSLSYLKRLPIDEVKIDRSFVNDIPDNPVDSAIVKAILVMSQSLGLQVCAEGVETERQAEFLRQQGCPVFQGYLYGKPVPISEFEAKLMAQRQAQARLASIFQGVNPA